MFNRSIDSIWEPKGIASRAGVEFLYNELLNEGSIALLNKPVTKKSKASKKSVKSKTKKQRT
jgi:hypothetical protein